jgi:hypothetical protein
MNLRKTATRRRAKLRLELLEDRVTPSVNVVANFESSASLANYRTVFHYYPTVDLAAAAAHDGLLGLDKHDGYEWMVSTDSAEQVHQGETISVWTQLAGTADGRAYLGFGTIAPSLTQDTSAFRTLALVLAPNTNQLLLQSISGNTTFTTFGTAAQTYQADHWYRMEVTWGTGGSITGKLYDSDGTTLLNTVTGTNNSITSGNIGIRAFGGDKYFDTYVVDTDSTATPAQLANAGGGLDPSWVFQTPPAAPTNGPAGGAVPLPWAYTNYTGPGPVREIQLDEWDSLAQIGSISNGQVIIAGQNTSHNIATGPNASGVDWGPGIQSAGSPATPQLAQYILRMLPGGQTTLISTSSVKHFFAPSVLTPGETDAYGSGLNASPGLFTWGSELNPVTGELYRPSDIGAVDVNGINQYTRTTPNAFDVAPHVAVADLDPAQNPAGTRWFAMANVYVEGEQDVTHASRWIEFTPHFNGTTFTFTYTDTGHLDFRTIPNLAQPAAGPYVTSQTPTLNGNTFGPVSDIIVTFDRPVDSTTFTTDSISSFTLTPPGGSQADLMSTLISVTQVDSDGKIFDIAFQSQTAVGLYSLTFGPNVMGQDGNPMDQDLDGVAGQPEDAYTATFTIQGPSITSGTPTGTGFNAVDHVHVTFNEPVDPTTFSTANITSFTQTVGTSVTDLSSALLSVTPSDGTNTQFDITFASQNGLGVYSMTIGTGILDFAGNPTTSPFTDSFTIKGPQIVSATPTGTANLPDANRKVRVTFNEPIDPATFPTSEVVATGPQGAIVVSAVTPVAGSNNTQFDITFPEIATGNYTVTIGPDIQDFAGHKMDQDGDFVDGQSVDMFVMQFGVQGLKVTAATLNSSQPGQAYDVHLTFNEPVDLSSFLTTAVTLTGPDGAHNAFGVIPTPGNFTQFDVLFLPLTAAGTYTLAVGPNITDVYGNLMDQDGNLVPGESTDAYTTTFNLVGPHVSSSSPTGTVTQPVDHVRLTFSEPMDPATFTLNQITAFTRTVGGTPTDLLGAVTGVSVVPFTNNTQFDVTFDTQGLAGTYGLTVSGDVADAYGNPMGTPATASFSVTGGPHVTSFSPTGTVTGPVDHVRVTFDRAIDASTFTPAQATLVMGGNPITITDVVEVAGSGQTQFDVTFDPQSVAGSYSLTLSTDITDLFGNHLIGASTTQLVTNGGFETGTFSGWTTIPASSGSDFGITTSPTHSGTHAAEFGDTVAGFYDTITQTLTTIPGQQYTFDYWLDNGGGPANGFRVMWGSTVVQNLVDSAAFGYTHFTFTVTATSTSTTISFAGYQLPSFFYLDDVSVTPIGGGLTTTFTIQ